MPHYYDRNGAPHHTVRGKNMCHRDTTLRDAREHGWLPSVSTVMEVVAKPGLNNWLQEQSMLAALTLPRIVGETEQDYLRRIRADAKRQAIEAANEGSRIHAAIESHFRGERYDPRYTEHVRGAVEQIENAFPEIRDWEPEVRFAHPDGWAGCSDLVSRSTGTVLDTKTKDLSPESDARLAFDQHIQLSAYACGLGFERPQLASLFVSRTHPGHARLHRWGFDAYDNGIRIFRAALELWKAIRGYDPSWRA